MQASENSTQKRIKRRIRRSARRRADQMPLRRTGGLLSPQPLPKPISSKPSRAINAATMARLIDRRVNALSGPNVSPDGASWAIGQLDPLHDTHYRAPGYPDLTSIPTLTLVERTTQTVSAPGAAAWDCHITMGPVLGHKTNTLSADLGQGGTITVNTTTDSTAQDFSHFTIRTVDTGGYTWPNAINFDSKDITSACWPENTTNLEKGPARCIGCCFEVVDTTAEVNKQGDVTVYTFTGSPTIANCKVVNEVPTDWGRMNVPLIPMPPYSKAIASAFPGAKTWMAKDGCYVVGRLNNVHNPLQTLSPIAVELSADYSTGAETQGVYLGETTLSTTIGANVIAPYDWSGAYFTNLHANASLTVTMVRILEISLNVKSYADFSLLTPSCVYDPGALAIYGSIINELPPGVHAADNAKGDWWRMVKKLIRKIAPAVATGIDVYTGSKIGTSSYDTLKTLSNTLIHPK